MRLLVDLIKIGVSGVQPLFSNGSAFSLVAHDDAVTVNNQGDLACAPRELQHAIQGAGCVNHADVFDRSAAAFVGLTGRCGMRS